MTKTTIDPVGLKKFPETAVTITDTSGNIVVMDKFELGVIVRLAKMGLDNPDAQYLKDSGEDAENLDFIKSAFGLL